MWDDIDHEIGSSREELAAALWNELRLGGGEKPLRFYNTSASALSIINHAMSGSKVVLDIQREMIDDKKPISRTLAGQELVDQLDASKQEILKRMEQTSQEGHGFRELKERYQSDLRAIADKSGALDVKKSQITAQKAADFQKNLDAIRQHHMGFDVHDANPRGNLGLGATATLVAVGAASACVVM